ncbi:DgyrCDS8779 [Dimorphilus gyrociliatus]|uniref:DgyrCDS8779 n=1 Tax=Dimorphilus gyrociliatus TaxID=2664684 RepID=A0A7I8VXD7_9ANNE|nr:DgyrCDS8779 [Dimorphilus gyrociliatus]
MIRSTLFVIFQVSRLSLLTCKKIEQHTPKDNIDGLPSLSTLQIRVIPRGTYFPIITPSNYEEKWLKSHLRSSGINLDNLKNPCSYSTAIKESHKLAFYKVNNNNDLDTNNPSTCISLFNHLRDERAIGLIFVFRDKDENYEEFYKLVKKLELFHQNIPWAGFFIAENLFDQFNQWQTVGYFITPDEYLPFISTIPAKDEFYLITSSGFVKASNGAEFYSTLINDGDLRTYNELQPLSSPNNYRYARIQITSRRIWVESVRVYTGTAINSSVIPKVFLYDGLSKECLDVSIISPNIVDYNCPYDFNSNSAAFFVSVYFYFPLPFSVKISEIKPKIFNMAVNTIISNEAGESNVGASGKSSQLQALIDAEDSSLLSITSLILSSSIKLAEPIEECKIHISFKMIYMINLILIQVKSLLSYQNDLGVLVEIDDNPTPLCNPYESSLPSFNFNWLQLPCTGVGSSIRITNNQDKFSFEELEIYVTDSNNPNIYNVEYTDNTGPDLSSYINIAPKLMIVSHLKDRSHFVWTDQDITTCDNSWNLSENPSIIFCHVRKLKVFFIRFKVKEFGSVNFQVVGINGYSISLSENNFNRTYDIDLRNITWITDEIGVKETTKATVCEVEIYGNLLPYENVNLINNSNWKITSSNQLDSTLKNLTDEDWSTRVCSNVTAYFNSYYQTFPWISIDLDAVYNVSYIFVTLSRVTNLDVTLTDYEIPRNYSEYSLHQVRRVCKLNLEISWSNLITCVKETRGKFLIFTAKEQQSLQLCEVSVFGSIYNKDYSLSRLPMIEKP